MCKLNREGFQTPKLPFPVRVCRVGGRNARHGTARRGGRRLIIARWPLAGVGKAAGTGGEPCPAARREGTHAPRTHATLVGPFARNARPVRAPPRPLARCRRRRLRPRGGRHRPDARRRDRGGPAVLPSCVAGRATMCCAVQALGRWLATWPGARRCPSEAPPIRI